MSSINFHERREVASFHVLSKVPQLNSKSSVRLCAKFVGKIILKSSSYLRFLSSRAFQLKRDKKSSQNQMTLELLWLLYFFQNPLERLLDLIHISLWPTECKDAVKFGSRFCSVKTGFSFGSIVENWIHFLEVLLLCKKPSPRKDAHNEMGVSRMLLF